MYIPVGIIIAVVVLIAKSINKPRPGPRRPPFEGPQIVGHPCVQCHVKIALYFDAQWCKHCERAVHNDCLAAHLAPVEGLYR